MSKMIRSSRRAVSDWVAVRAVGDGNIGVVGPDHALHERVGPGLGRVPDAQPPLKLLVHDVQELVLDLGVGRLVVERLDGHRPDVGREATAGEAVLQASRRRQREGEGERD